MGGRKIASFGLIILFCLGLVHSSLGYYRSFAVEQHDKDFSQTAENLYIHSNGDWETQGWLGNGSAKSPFIIENEVFDGCYIENSSVFFIVRNCQFQKNGEIIHVENGVIEDSWFNQGIIAARCSKIVFSNISKCEISVYESSNIVMTNVTAYSPDGYSNCIDIYDSENITVDKCSFEGFAWGITIHTSMSCTIQHSNFTDCGYWPSGGPPNQGGGVYIRECVECSLFNNTFIDNYGVGFTISYSESIDIIYNYSDDSGNIVQDCVNCSILNNNLNDGLGLWRSKSCDVISNEFGTGGLSINGYLDQFMHNVINNTLQGKKLLYVLQESDSIYANTEYGQIYVVDSPRVSLINDIVTISQLGIFVFTSESCLISQVESTRIRIQDSPRSIIQNSEIGGGIWLLDSAEVVIKKNTVKDSEAGILLGQNSTRSIISNNTVLSVRRNGIEIGSSDCWIENNTITGCGNHLSACYTTTTIVQDIAAIRIHSDDCRIINNVVVDNYGYGIWITGKRNTIYKNVIARNSLGNGLSSGEGNQWDNGIDTGNTWGDWSLIGVYFVPGSEHCVDRYPNGYKGNTTVLGISFTALMVTSLSIGGACSILIVYVKFYRPRVRANT